MPPPIYSDPTVWYTVLFRLIKERRFSEAAELCWPWMGVNPWTTRIFTVLEQHKKVCIIGHASAAKTFTSAAWDLLNWMYWGTVKGREMGVLMTGPTTDSMRSRAWGDMKRLFYNSRYPLPGKLLDHRMAIALKVDKGDGGADTYVDDKHIIKVVAADSRSENKIRGMHPPQLIVDMDEADNPLNEAAWDALSNLEASGNVQIIAKTNPTDPNTPFGMACEPEGGWGSVNIDSSHEWRSRLGWYVLRLDGLLSPNIVAGQDQYPFLMSNGYVQAKRLGEGEKSAAWSTYVRAWFPDEGMVQTVFARDLVTKVLANVQTFYGDTVKVLACDPAFEEGGDKPTVILATVGREVRDPMKTLVRIDEIITLKRRDKNLLVHQDYAVQCAEIALAQGVLPKHVVMDNTGAGLAFSDIVASKLGGEIMRVGFGGKATEGRHIMPEDSRPCHERFDRFVTELWFAASDWFKSGQVFFSPALKEQTEVIRLMRIDLEGRRYRQLPKEKVSIEPKKEMKERGLHSPDCGDAVSLLIHLVALRLAERLPSALPKSVAITQDHRQRLKQRSGMKRGWNFQPKYAREQTHDGKGRSPVVLPWERVK